LIVGQLAHDKHVIIPAERIVAPDPESVAWTGLSFQVVLQIREVVEDPPFRRHEGLFARACYELPIDSDASAK
jgi:hypothetical protein